MSDQTPTPTPLVPGSRPALIPEGRQYYSRDGRVRWEAYAGTCARAPGCGRRTCTWCPRYRGSR